MCNRGYRASLLMLIGLMVFSCKGQQTSSGFQLEQTRVALPPGVPKRVGVALFAGEVPINQQATDQFSAGLLELGFDVIERSNFQSILDEIEISSTDLFSESTRNALGEQLALEALFTGSIIDEDGTLWVNSHVNVKLVDIDTGRIIWAASASDPRSQISRRKVQANTETSVTHSVRGALELLKSDLQKMEANKQQNKRDNAEYPSDNE